MERFKK